MNGFSSSSRGRQETLGRYVVGGESPRPREVAPWKAHPPWYLTPEAWPWRFSEKRDQYEARRKYKHQVI
jgi:hypothetical protein